MTTFWSIMLYACAGLGIYSYFVKPVISRVDDWDKKRKLPAKTVVKLPALELRGICGREPGGEFRPHPLVTIDGDGHTGLPLRCCLPFGHLGGGGECVFGGTNEQTYAVHQIQTGMQPKLGHGAYVASRQGVNLDG